MCNHCTIVDYSTEALVVITPGKGIAGIGGKGSFGSFGIFGRAMDGVGRERESVGSLNVGMGGSPGRSGIDTEGSPGSLGSFGNFGKGRAGRGIDRDSFGRFAPGMSTEGRLGSLGNFGRAMEGIGNVSPGIGVRKESLKSVISPSLPITVLTAVGIVVSYIAG